MAAKRLSLNQVLSQTLRRIWRGSPWSAAAIALLPLAFLHRALWSIWKAKNPPSAERPKVFTIVIGNVIVGGAGKTPITLASVQYLLAQGFKPGIISRGYGRKNTPPTQVLEVRPDSQAEDVGDEPFLLASSCAWRVPVYVCAQRKLAAEQLLREHPEVNVLICDDGLQHLQLARNLEICVFNEDGIGNGWMLPAGSLREPWPRKTDAVMLYAGSGEPKNTPDSTKRFTWRRNLADFGIDANGQRVPLSTLSEKKLYAVAGIARPEVFFSMLKERGLVLERTFALADHADFSSFNSFHGFEASNHDAYLLCTEKDAAKLWKHYPSALAVPLRVEIEPQYYEWLSKQIAQTTHIHDRPKTS